MPSRRRSIRSARADNTKVRPLSSGIGISPLISAAIPVRLPRRAISQSENQAAMRRKRGHHSARASGRSINGAKYFWPMPRKARRGIVGQRRGEGLGEFAERIVDRRTAVGRRQRHVDGIERVEPQNVFGVDRVGIAQPVLDRGHRQFQRPRRARRFRRGLRNRFDLRRGCRAGRRSGRIVVPPIARRSSALRRRRLPAGAGSARPPPARRRPSRRG